MAGRLSIEFEGPWGIVVTNVLFDRSRREEGESRRGEIWTGDSDYGVHSSNWDDYMYDTSVLEYYTAKPSQTGAMAGIREAENGDKFTNKINVWWRGVGRGARRIEGRELLA